MSAAGEKLLRSVRSLRAAIEAEKKMDLLSPEWPDLLRRMRMAAGWRQEDLADRVGLSRQSINMIEQARSVPSLQTIRRLREVLPGLPSPYDDIEE